MKKLTKVASVAFLVMFLGVPVLAFGQGVPPAPDIPGENPTDIEGGQSIVDLLTTILTWIGMIFWIFAVGFILYAGFLYLTAAGDATKVTTAASQFKYGIIAIIIGLLAYGLPRIVANILSSQ